MRIVDAHFQPPRIFVAELGSAEPLATGTSFPHVHIHVVPIHQRGEEARPAQVFSWTSGIVAYRPEEAASLVAALRVRLAALGC
jgi:diadenosine tetraphosphate (Ap4A) HIT family hydrolase